MKLKIDRPAICAEVARELKRETHQTADRCRQRQPPRRRKQAIPNCEKLPFAVSIEWPEPREMSSRCGNVDQSGTDRIRCHERKNDVSAPMRVADTGPRRAFLESRVHTEDQSPEHEEERAGERDGPLPRQLDQARESAPRRRGRIYDVGGSSHSK